MRCVPSIIWKIISCFAFCSMPKVTVSLSWPNNDSIIVLDTGSAFTTTPGTKSSLNELILTVKHDLIRKAFNIHLKHHVFESLLNTLNVLSYVKPKVLFEWQQSLSSSTWDIDLWALTADFFFFVLIKVYRQRLSQSSSYSNIDDRTLLADPVLVLIKDWQGLRHLESE